MNKPLELTVYPPLAPPPMPSDLRDEAGWAAHDAWLSAAGKQIRAKQAKHLTEAELCAEFEAARCDSMIQSQTGRCWQPLGYTWPMDPESIHDRANVLLRFASRPHYFEEP